MEIKQLGKGSFGSVFLVRERGALRRDWVMKRVALRGLQPRERSSAFQEVRLLQTLRSARHLHPLMGRTQAVSLKRRHPHICSYYESFVHKPLNQLCIVMTFCDGGDLHSRVQAYKKRHKALQEAQVVRWMLQLTLALEYIHDQHSIIHRDLKTQNVFLMLDDSLKLSDFGVSRVCAAPATQPRPRKPSRGLPHPPEPRAG